MHYVVTYTVLQNLGVYYYHVYIYIRNHMSTVYIFSCMKYGHEHNKTAALATLMLFTKLMLMFLYM